MQDAIWPNPTSVHPSILSEVRMAMLIVHHNTFFNLSDHLSKWVGKEFKSCTAGENFSCGRTKTAAIVNCVGASMKHDLVNTLQEEPFSIMLDASNDSGLYKMFPVTVRLFDVNFDLEMTKFLDMNMLVGRDASTARAEFDSVNTLFEKFGLSWHNVTGLGLDNTNSNIGARNSIKQRALEKNTNIFINGCPCHILHNAASKANSEFSKISGFDLEDHSVDLYYWFDKSSKRKSALLEYYEFCDQEFEEVIRYVSTRWLCLEKCVNRKLKKFAGLRLYFLSEGLKDERFGRLEKAFTNPMTELFIFFFQSALVTFTNFNKFLQREDPLIYLEHEQMNNFMTKLALKFIKPEVIRSLKANGKAFSELDISLKNQRADKDLTIGFTTKQKLVQLMKEDIMEGDCNRFFDAVRAFYETAYNYCKKWLPLDNPFLKNCQFVDFKTRSQVTFDNVSEMICQIKTLHGHYITDPVQLDLLEEEFLQYQSLAQSDVPSYIWVKVAVCDSNTVVFHRMDIVWAYLREPFPLLSKIALSILTIPHSNAAEERVFSMIKKNKTAYWANLDLSGSLDSIMVIKMNSPEELAPCYQMTFSDKLLKKCKSACRNYNSEHGNAKE